MIKNYVLKIIDDRLTEIETYTKKWCANCELDQIRFRNQMLEHSKQVEEYLKGFNEILEKKL